jgi:hypothetical protein
MTEAGNTRRAVRGLLCFSICEPFHNRSGRRLLLVCHCQNQITIRKTPPARKRWGFLLVGTCALDLLFAHA